MTAPPFGQDHATVAAAPYQNTPLAYRQLTVTTEASLVALLAAATPPYVLTQAERTALFSVEGNAIRWTDDGQVPTTTYGQPLAAAQAEQISSIFSAMLLVSQSGTATVNVTFYR